MANDWEASAKQAAQKFADALRDAAELEVETLYTEVSPEGGEETKLAAKTIIKVDGDSTNTIPMHKTQAGDFEVDTPLYEIHQRNVTAAIEYRARILNALLSALQSRLR